MKKIDPAIAHEKQRILLEMVIKLYGDDADPILNALQELAARVAIGSGVEPEAYSAGVFEASRDRLGWLIGLLKSKLVEEKERRRATAAEEIPVSYTRTNYNQALKREYSRRLDYPKVTLEFTRANFDALVDENSGSPRTDQKLWSPYEGERMKEGGFDRVLKDELLAQDTQIGHTKSDLANCEKYYADWKQTHRWDKAEKTWVAL